MVEKHEISIPEQGQIVTVRQRRFVVADIQIKLEQKIVALRKRYADPVSRLFPVAVTFLVPEKYDH